MNQASRWLDLVEQYISYRRSLGFELEAEEVRLRDFAQFAGTFRNEEHLTVSLAADWARASKKQTPITWARRLEALRGFAKYVRRFDPATEVPQSDMFGPVHRRLVPHIYSDAEMIALLDAAMELYPRGGLRPVTCRTVFGLLASAGLRISEATALRRADFDASAHLLHIRDAKFHKERWVPIHPSVTEVLCSYGVFRDRLVVNPKTDHFFLMDDGKPATPGRMRHALSVICRTLNWLQPRGDHRHYRLHDFRHSFIVRAVQHSYRQGADPDKAVGLLSMYVGHARVAHTYWYFTGTSELMSLVAERFQNFFQEDVK